MFARHISSFVALATALIMFAGAPNLCASITPVQISHSGVEANGPVALTEEPAFDSNKGIEGSRHQGIKEDKALIPLTPSLDGSTLGASMPALEDVARSAIENTPLGPPGSGPVDRGSASPEAEAETLGRDESASALGTRHSAFDSLTRLDPRTNEVTKVISALAVVLGILLALRGAMKRMGGSGLFAGARGARPSGVLEILARYPIARGQSLMLLKLGRRIVLVHHYGPAVTALSEVTDPDEVASLLSRLEAGAVDGSRDAARFRNTLQEFMSESTVSADQAAKPRRARHQRTVLPPGESEIVDLTRRRRGVFSGWFGGKGEAPSVSGGLKS